MSIPNEALQKLVQEIESQAILAQREIHVVKTAVSAKQRDVRLLELTTSEVKALPRDTNVYEGIGKMFVSKPMADVEKRLSSETAELKSDISNLNKKLHYLETTHKNSKDHIEQIFQSGGRA
ncbi:MAG: prefoldin subunit 1 [Lasallia pustulata]|uniref:Prefoldin subunit 1 n=1 Tax=Lasallia pustulata TaxID=136370 RepID=A0A1W5D2W3_9LECA|nr:MAG: prefoldin subunit 1 [Lasallia pustulata]SLM37426.1 prefoldin subunit 1 [Lasallia pustulata]